MSKLEFLQNSYEFEIINEKQFIKGLKKLKKQILRNRNMLFGRTEMETRTIIRIDDLLLGIEND